MLIAQVPGTAALAKGFLLPRPIPSYLYRSTPSRRSLIATRRSLNLSTSAVIEVFLSSAISLLRHHQSPMYDGVRGLGAYYEASPYDEPAL